MTITGKDQSILFQVAFKAAVELASHEPLADNAAIFALTYEFYDFLAGEHGFTSLNEVESQGDRNDGQLDPAEQRRLATQTAPATATQAQAAVEDAFPGTERVAAGTKDEHFVAPRAGTDGYEFTGDCKLPIPDWFYTQVEAKGASNLKYWWDNRNPDGSAPVGETGKKRPSFTSKVPKGGDKSKQVAIFEPDKPRAR